MVLDYNLDGFRLPCIIQTDAEYYECLKIEFAKYLGKIKELYEEKIYEETKNNVDFILKALENYYNANMTGAEECITSILRENMDSPYIVSELKKSYAFKASAAKEIRSKIYKESDYICDNILKKEVILFRARVNSQRLEEEQMLHIPFNMRGKISTQRFSMYGVPSFYFATTSFGAWMELGMPDLKKFQVSGFFLPENLKILNLCIYQDFINGFSNIEEEKEILNCFVKFFPLVIASSYRVLEEERKFKSEYIISQLIMQASIKLGIDGIAYLSKKMEDNYSFPQSVNLAILIPQNKNLSSMYWSRMSDVIYTSPFFMEDIPKDFNSKNETLINEFFQQIDYDEVKVAEQIICYSKMKFSKFDSFIYDKLCELREK